MGCILITFLYNKMNVSHIGVFVRVNFHAVATVDLSPFLIKFFQGKHVFYDFRLCLLYCTLLA